MPAPISIPPQRVARTHHRAAQIANACRDAPRRSALATTAADRETAQGWTFDQYMPLSRYTDTLADQPCQIVSSSNRIGSRARMTRIARPVHFSRCNAGEPHPGAFRAPHRPVTVPNPRWGAGEGFTGWNNGGGGEQEQRHTCRNDAPSADWQPGMIRGEHMKALIASAALALATLVPASGEVCLAAGCCKTCSKGKACGDSCIARDKPCAKPKGCACNG